MGTRTANPFAMKGHLVKILLDTVVRFLLLLLMAHSLIGEMAHEWMGIGVLLLLLLHLILNGKWLGTIFIGRYTAYRIFQSTLVLLLAVTMLGSMVSGVILSKYLFRFLQIDSGRFLVRTIHMLCGYWGFILVSLHIGLHASVMISKVKRRAPKLPVWSVRFLRIIAWAIVLSAMLLFAVIGHYGATVLKQLQFQQKTLNGRQPRLGVSQTGE